MTNKKSRKKIFPVFIFWIFAALIFYVALFFLFFNKPRPSSSIYVSSETVKQGDTVFIKVESSAEKVAGNFEKENLVFFKKNNSNEWISFLGIDADQKPGDYEVYVNTSNAEHLTKEIKVGLADFSLANIISAPTAQNKTTNQQAINNIIKNDNPAISKIIGNFTATPYFSLPFSYPLSSMKDSGFSFGQFIGFGKLALQHLGVDLRAPEKTKIYAVNNGKVVAILNLSNYGKTVIIDHGLDIFSLYLHLDEFKVSVGDMVSRGQEIGLSGDTGYVSAPHLHFSMRVDGTRVDPIVFIKTTQQMDNNSFTADISNAVLNIFKK